MFSIFAAISYASLFYSVSAWPSSGLPSRQTRATEVNSSCLCYPGDSCWPTRAQWNEFNTTLGGKLIATVPIASVCHNDEFGHFNDSACAQLRSVWDFTETHWRSSSSVMAPYFANASCDPFTAPSAQCVVGAYIQYAVNASKPEDFQKTLAFVKKHDIRLVIRNTAHDYLGKSTGAGAVGIWTHNIKDISVVDYQSAGYSGKAMKVGAGIQMFDAYSVAQTHNLAIVGGNCESVGLTGGYSQGGGHSLLASRFGLAADQVLEWEAVTGRGEHVIATPDNEHKDLYWALSGGGGGTYAVVYSAIIKAHPEPKAAAANITFTNQGVSQDAYWRAVSTWLSISRRISDARGGSLWLLSNASFSVYPAMIPDGSRAQMQALMQPLLDVLKQQKMNYTYYVNEWPKWSTGFKQMNVPENVTEISLAGRLLPRSLLTNNSSLQHLTDTIRSITDSGALFSGVSLNVSRAQDGQSQAANAVLPAWRTAGFDAVIGIPYDSYNLSANKASQKAITNVLLPQLDALSPGGGAYLNEGDPWQPNWQQVFYGDNYAKLKQIKKKHDPQNVFYGLTCVGSEAFTQHDDGRLCRV